METYLGIVEEQWKIHRIEERLEALSQENLSYPVSAEFIQALERIDNQIGEIWQHAEKNCRKITKIDGNYSVTAHYWHERALALKALLKRLDGKTTNDGNICRAARRFGINHPRRLNRAQIQDLLQLAVARKQTIKPQSRFLRDQHMKTCLARADHAKDTAKATEIREKISRESSKSMWGRINKVVRAPHPGALMRVEREINGEKYEFTDEKELVHNILDEIQDRYSGAEDAPISNCSITEALGQFGFSELGMEIIGGHFNPPEDLDEASCTVLRAIGEIGKKHMKDDINIEMSRNDYISIWNKAREKTSSSRSGRHFGHYIACAKSTLLSSSMALKISLHAAWGAPAERWKSVLMVMLEKNMGVLLIPKLRAIILREADNNLHDGFIFNGRMLTHAKEIGFIPQEQLAEKDKTSEDGVLLKVLKADYARLRRVPFAIISADAANCYDMVNHIILAMLLLALGIPMGPILSMLITIGSMKYFLRTGYGESSEYMGGDRARRRVHGLNQGGRASPSSWLVVSSLLVKIHRARGHVATVMSPISKMISKIMGSLFVDDSDLLILDKAIQTPQDLLRAAQASLTDWGSHLMATGGGCKPEKCFGYLSCYSWDDNGSWHCDSLVDGYELTVPLADGGTARITLHNISDGKETLGVFTAPDGNSQAHFQKITDKADTWTARISNGHLPVSFNWTSYIYQLWTSIRYGIGIGALPADETEVESVLQDSYRGMLPFLGVNRNIKRGWRTLHRSFLGIGLFDFSTEMMIQRVNIFLQHYDSPFDIGITLRAVMELVQLEAGFADCPLNHPFHPVGQFVTHCWFRSFWQAFDKFNCRMFLSYPTIPFPRERDHVLTTFYQQNSNDPQMVNFRSFQRCRISVKAIFLSDIVSPDGRMIEDRYLFPQDFHQPPLSEYDFAEERPSKEDWEVWVEFWDSVTYPGFVLPTALGDSPLAQNK